MIPTKPSGYSVPDALSEQDSMEREILGVITSVLILVATFTAGGIYRNHIERETESGNKPLDAANGNRYIFSFCYEAAGKAITRSRTFCRCFRMMASLWLRL